MGVDLSLVATGLVALDGKGEHAVDPMVVGHSLSRNARLRDKTERAIHGVQGVIGFVKEIGDRNVPIRIERPAYGARGDAVTELAGIHMVVRVQLHLAGFLDVEYVTATSARAKVLGKGWGRKSKKEIRKELQRRGYSFPDDNVMDAWVVARHALDLPALEVQDG